MSKYTCHTITNKLHEGDDLPALISAALCDLMPHKLRSGQLQGGQLRVGSLKTGYQRKYKVSYEIVSQGTRCRAAVWGHFREGDHYYDNAWLYGWTVAPFHNLSLKLSEEFMVAFTLHRLQGKDEASIPVSGGSAIPRTMARP